MAFGSTRSASLPYLLRSSIIMCRLTANEPKKKGPALSSNSSPACPSPAPVKALGTNRPAQGRTERGGRGRAVSCAAVWHSLAGSSGSLPLRVFSSHIHQHPFLTLVRSLAPTSTLSPHFPLGWPAFLEQMFYFLH